jgi:hypothetical protein
MQENNNKPKRKYTRKANPVIEPTNSTVQLPIEKTLVKPRKNEIYSNLMGELLSIMVKRGDNIRARVYRRAQESILAIPDDIYSPQDLTSKPGIGPIILEKLKTYEETGT